MGKTTKDALERMNAKRFFPKTTCSASRHVAQIAEALAKGEKYIMLEDEPELCSESMAGTVSALWETRTRLEILREWIRDTGNQNNICTYNILGGEVCDGCMCGKNNK